MINNPLWVEKYRPKTIAETILPAATKRTFQGFVDSGSMPNLLLSGPSGLGKSSVALALFNEMEYDWIKKNGSLDVNVDLLRTDLTSFCSSVSLYGNRKAVLLDEADYMGAATVQPALRAFMEDFPVSWIMTCNYPNKILPELHGRCSVVEFSIPKAEKNAIAKEFMTAIVRILELENVSFDKKAVAEVVKKHFPNFRRTINELQKYAAQGPIDAGILTEASGEIDDLIGFLKAKDFSKVRNWVALTSMEQVALYKRLEETSGAWATTNGRVALTLVLNKYSTTAGFALDAELHTTAAMVEVMIDLDGEFK